jgi:hypothetical protein
MFKVVIVGGEHTHDYARFKKKCIECLKNKAKEGGIIIYTTGDRFVDAFSERYGIDTRFFPCDFKHYGKDALKYRAEAILEDADAVIAFNDGQKDSQMIAKMAAEKGLPLRIIR